MNLDQDVAPQSKEVNNFDEELGSSFNLSLDKLSLEDSYEAKIKQKKVSICKKPRGVNYNPNMPKMEQIEMMTGP